MGTYFRKIWPTTYVHTPGAKHFHRVKVECHRQAQCVIAVEGERFAILVPGSTLELGDPVA